MESQVPILEVDARRVWSPRVFCFDDSEWGEGILSTLVEPSEAASIGAYSEKWRFRAREPPPRELAHQAIMDSLLAAEDHESLEKYLASLQSKKSTTSHRMLSAAEHYAESLDPSRHIPLSPGQPDQVSLEALLFEALEAT